VYSRKTLSGEPVVRKPLLLVSVVLTGCFVTGFVYACHGGAGTSGKAKGNKADSSRVMGVIKGISTGNSAITIATGKPQMNSKDGKGGKNGVNGGCKAGGRTGENSKKGDKVGKGEQTSLTVAVTADTKILIGDAPGKLGDLAIGSRVMVSYESVGNVAVMIRELTGQKTAEGKGGKRPEKSGHGLSATLTPV
jgi:hypothetical protein